MRLSEAAKALREAGVENALGEARIIFTTLGGFSAADTVGRDIDCECERVHDAIRRRCEREPLQYIIGEVDFYRESYKVSPDCLIPRQDTEVLVDYAVKHLPRGAAFLDLCTGSGCIAISTLKNTKNTAATALDLSAAALALARDNAERMGVSERITLLEQDVLAHAVEGEFFAVLSNPPYVTEAVYRSLEPEIFFEPREAFVAGGILGTEFYSRITELYCTKIQTDGFIAYEIGYDQADTLCDIAAKNGMSCEIIKDFSGNDRVAVLKRTK